MARKMKNSGFAWIGEIPANWDIQKVKFLYQVRGEKDRSDAQVLSLYRELGVVIKSERNDNHNATSENTSNYKFVMPTDIVVNKMKAWQGSIGASEYEGIVSPAYYVFKQVSDLVYYRFVHYLLRNKSYVPEYRRLSGGIRIGQWDLSLDNFKQIPVLIPPLEEQKNIANFLDRKCGELDQLIKRTQDSIEQYRKYKQAVITRAVTGGLKKNRKMKTCDNEWLPSIPYEWELYRLKFYFTFGKGLNITKDDLADEGIPVISYGQIHAKSNPGTTIVDELYRYVPQSYLLEGEAAMVKYDDFVFADTSEDLAGCGNCVYIDRDENIFAGYHTIILRPVEEWSNRFLAYLFQSDLWRSQIRLRVSGIKLFSISQKILRELTIILPPKEEQEEIVGYLNAKCSKIDKLIQKKETFITELENYKKILIYEYVTGKREVS